MENPIHKEPHPRGYHVPVPVAASTASGMEPKTRKRAEGDIVTIANGSLAGRKFMIEEWWDRVHESPWDEAAIDEPPYQYANPLCATYRRRVQKDGLPTDHEVVAGLIQGENERGDETFTPALVHASEIGD